MKHLDKGLHYEQSAINHYFLIPHIPQCTQNVFTSFSTKEFRRYYAFTLDNYENVLETGKVLIGIIKDGIRGLI